MFNVVRSTANQWGNKGSHKLGYLVGDRSSGGNNRTEGGTRLVDFWKSIELGCHTCCRVQVKVLLAAYDTRFLDVFENVLDFGGVG